MVVLTGHALYCTVERCDIQLFTKFIVFRLPGTSIRSFLLKCQNGPLMGIESREIHELCDEYEHARHHYEEFGDDKLRVSTADSCYKEHFWHSNIVSLHEFGWGVPRAV